MRLRFDFGMTILRSKKNLKRIPKGASGPPPSGSSGSRGKAAASRVHFVVRAIHIGSEDQWKFEQVLEREYEFSQPRPKGT